MNDILKQRLVGALILVALGVVFWPIIFVEPGDQRADEQVRIPPRPAVSATPIEPPDQAGLRASRELEMQRVEAQRAEMPEPQTVTPAPEADENKSGVIEKQLPAPIEQKPVERTRTEPPQKLEVDSDGVPVAWILQVASVSSSDKAEQLRGRLLQLDQKAYVKKVKRGGKNLYRVYIGPKFERAKLEALQPVIDAEFGVSSMIARYVP